MNRTTDSARACESLGKRDLQTTQVAAGETLALAHQAAADKQVNWVACRVDADAVSSLTERGSRGECLTPVTEPLVVPINKVVRVQVTGADVIHAFALPAFGLKTDGIPGRLNETWFRAEKTGTYYGQCSELCGVDHAFMPIEIKVVSQGEFNAWVKAKAPPPAPAAPAAEAADAQKAIEAGQIRPSVPIVR